MKVGIYGGTFDPVHNEHINIGKNAILELGLDKLIILPTGVPPHKENENVTNKKVRLEMCKTAFNDEKMEISTYEIEKRGVSFTFEALEHFKNPDDELFLIVGGDSLQDMEHWKEPEHIFELATVFVCGRLDEVVSDKFKDKVIFSKYQPQNFSSTKIRVEHEFGISIEELVPKDVLTLIENEGLYSKHKKMTKKVKKFVTDKRFEHIINTTVMGQILADGAGVEKEKAFIACAVHDIAKNIQDFSEFKVKLEGEKMLLPEPVIHAFVGSYMLKKELGIKDKDIKNAVKYHTTARANMSQLEKLVYVSDCLEEGRVYEGVEKIRKIARINFEEAFKMCLTLAYRGIVDKIICPLTLDAIEYYKGNN